MEYLVSDGTPREGMGEAPNEESYVQRLETPIAAFHPDLGMVNMSQIISASQELVEGVAAKGTTCQNMKKAQHQKEVDSQDSVVLSQEFQETPEAPAKIETDRKTVEEKIVVHDLDGVYLMDKSKWPALNEPEKSNNNHASYCQEDLMENLSSQEMDSLSEEDNTQGWVVRYSNKKKKKVSKKGKRNLAVATRASKRVPRDGIPITVKAMTRVKEMNDLQKGKDVNPFTILNNAPVDHLHRVLSDLEVECDELHSQINVFRAEELVRADLAQANYNAYIQKINAKSAPQGEDCLAELAMGAISNIERGLSENYHVSAHLPALEDDEHPQSRIK
jgi:hypothetical protein